MKKRKSKSSTHPNPHSKSAKHPPNTKLNLSAIPEAFDEQLRRSRRAIQRPNNRQENRIDFGWTNQNSGVRRNHHRSRQKGIATAGTRRDVLHAIQASVLERPCPALASPPDAKKDGMDPMRRFARLISISLLIACKTNAIPPNQINEFRTLHNPAIEQPKTSKDAPLEFLLTSAAADLHAQHRSHTIHFRKVHIGHVMTPGGEMQYMLCGQFLTARPEDKGGWAPFATIKTSGYEQWLGDQAASFCKRPSIVWEKGDLSPLLQTRFDSLP
jgi:hypothetical protein